MLAGGRLIARSIYNGEVLWSRPFSKENFGRYGSLLAATPERVFFKEDNRVLVLNPETGGELLRVTAADQQRDCIWLAVSDGVLLTLAGPRHTYTREEWIIFRQADAFSREKSLYLGEELAAWDGESGRQLWQFRAPRIEPYKLVVSDGRVMLWGYLSGAWPVMANVLVENGVAYAAGGQLAWYQGKLWWHCSEWGLAIIDPANGDLRPAIDLDRLKFRGQSGFFYGPHEGVKRGQDIGILPGGWVAYGGRQFNLPLRYVEQPRASCYFLRADPDGPPQDPQGLPKLAVLKLSKAHNTGDLPVWDSTEVVLTGRPTAWQTEPLGPVLCRRLAETLAVEMEAHPFDVSRKDRSFGVVPVRRTDIEPPAGHSRLLLPDEWVKKHGNQFHGPILASNAVVFASGWIPRGAWSIMAVSRTDQSLLWDVPLPGMPVLGGMALTPAGDVLAPLVDGRLVCIGGRHEAIPRAAVSLAATQPGLIVQTYRVDGTVAPTELPRQAELAGLKPSDTALAAQIELPSKQSGKPYLLRFSGLLDVAETGTYRFFLFADRSYSRFLLHDQPQFDCAGWGAQSGEIFLAKGKHPITILYRHGEGGKILRLEWEGTGSKRAVVPASALSHAGAKKE